MDTDKDILTKLLLDAQDQDDSIRSVAEGKLKQRQEHDFPDFLLSLSAELLKDASPPDCRRLAGIILKNSVEGKYSEHNNRNIKRWINLDELIKSKIKESLLITLGSSAAEARHASSQIIGKLAYIEILSRDWQDLIDILLGNMAHQGASPPLKQATLETLEYVFEEFLGLKQDAIDGVLDAVIRAMNRAEQSSEVCLAAVKALHNVLKFANFANEDCRKRIMTAICNAAKSDEAAIKEGAFGCLTAIVPEYYMVLEPYMETILSLTTEALKGGAEKVALQCIEFWSTICEQVIKLREQKKHFAHVSSTADCRFIEKPLCSLVPVLLGTLLNQEGDVDALNIFTSATTCLGLVARTIGNAIVPLAMQFVEGNIQMAESRSRKAATYALGVILEGPSIDKLAPVVGLLVDRMEDPNIEVRGAAVCTLGRVFELLHSPALAKRFFTDEDFRRIMAVLSKSGKDVPEVSKEVCRAIYFLARELDKKTPFGTRASASAYEALTEVVRVSNIHDYKASIAIRVLMPRIMRRLNTALDAEAITSSDKGNKYNLQALLCDLLLVIIQKLGGSREVDMVKEYAQFVLVLFCRVLTCDCYTARDKAALAIGALARAVGPKFVDLMSIFLQYYNVNLFSPIYLEVIGNIFHVLGDEILPYCDYMMYVLFEGLSERALKPQILACFGEIALAIGKNFEEYLQDVIQKLREADNPRYYDNIFDEDKVDYGSQLRQGIFKAYSGILRGIKDPKSGLKVAADLVEFIEGVCKDENRGASVTYTAVDVLSEFGSTVESWTQGLISEVMK
ncbi:hypothetical protein QYE76_068888 [Lolium multiflorum]|uniref:Importin N-terminal domain-containing protein n=1 Tax=Lolium multiflorum TaxID=4521 RepID=A0AAD8SGC4_LOLMU|nr:hypothetical protein QYE76_068888 [Lolium multiflorum]